MQITLYAVVQFVGITSFCQRLEGKVRSVPVVVALASCGLLTRGVIVGPVWRFQL